MDARRENTTIGGTNLHDFESALTLLKRVRDGDHERSLHRTCSWRDISAVAEIHKEGLFNTCFVLHSRSSKTPKDPLVLMRDLQEQYRIELNLLIIASLASDDTLTVELGFWQSKLSIAQADSLASTFSKTFSSILRNPRVFTHDLDMLSSRDRTQITQWNSFAMTAVECCVHAEINLYRENQNY